MGLFSNDNNTKDLHIIKTARDIDSINKAVEAGLSPLFRKVIPSEEIKSKYAVCRNRQNGEFVVLQDYRDVSRHQQVYEIIIDWTFYYPYSFSSPFAAHLIPRDLVVGERVFIKDLIEDYVGINWNQGNAYRLQSCEAIWDGEDLKIQPKETTKKIYRIK